MDKTYKIVANVHTGTFTYENFKDGVCWLSGKASIRVLPKLFAMYEKAGYMGTVIF